MKARYIILRDSGPAARSSPQVRSFSRTASSLTIDVEELAPRDLASLAEKKIFVAPAMPMRLIAPFAAPLAVPGSDDTPPSEETEACAWGVQAVKADTSPFTGAGVTVAVLDSGIVRSLPVFDDIDVIEKDFTGEGVVDVDGHGTHCAGTIFGHDVSGTRIAVAPGVKRVLIGKVLSTEGAASDQIANAIMWAVDNGAHVISMSLGMDFPGFVKQLVEEDGYPPELATSHALEGYRTNLLLFERLASYLRVKARSTLLVAAAGNESRRDIDPRFQIAVSPPAVVEGILSVGAVGRHDDGLRVANFSNYGPKVSAPGVEIMSVALDGKLQALSGTSMAAPHVAGVAALWAEKMLKKGPLGGTQLEARVVGQTSTDEMAAGYSASDIGEGIVQAPQM
ncbi:subtilase family protein [Paraburkholderia sp. BL6669N2]|uniref:S8 family peptidase n=1 Tax=Paraburkholderia sp. BL6669N2 TaxID=1938807 RepID=UPI000E370E5D|nr:S8 family serine peptidase [Paraburkholderia sp. BL6669N2]REG45533.1 subtilase family protein [Paraburkholderia sp. BL6669N2]